MNLLEFFQELYSDAECSLYLWTMPDKRTRVFSSRQLTDMANTALQLSASGQNVFFGVGGCPPNLGQYERPKIADVTSITALWCDIDIAGDGHAAQNLPPDIASAISLLPTDLPASIIVHSGHGLHAYWLLKEEWLFDGEGERERASDVLRRIQGYIRQKAQARGWKVDATADLPRVLRCPDTMNYKNPRQAVLCRVIESAPSRRYNESDFDILPPVEVSSAPIVRTEKFERRDTDGDADMMLNNCAFLQHCQFNAATISYNEWVTAITNIVRARDGIDAAHAFSKLDTRRYSEAGTDGKISEALDKMNPQGCAYIRDALGFAGCPSNGCGVKAPCGWSLGKLPQARAIVRGISNITAEAVFDPDVICALAELKINDKIEFGRFMEACKGRIDCNNLKAAIRQSLNKPTDQRIAEIPQQDVSTSDERGAALSEGQRLGDVTTRLSISDTPLDLDVPANFSYGRDGIYYQTTTREGLPKYMRACGTPIIITRRIYNLDTNLEKVELAFKYFNQWRTVVQQKNSIYVSRNITCLSNFGVNVTSESAKYLVRYLAELENVNAGRIPLMPAVSRLGWRTENGVIKFLTPTDTNYTFDMEDSGELTSAFTVRGDFSLWLNTSRQVREYQAARFVLAASFATPLLKLFNHRNFMIYFWGTSGGGKTAAMTWALSVWGVASELMVNFNMSMAGLEGRLALTSDLPAGINERQAAGGGRDKQEWLERIVYMVEGGRGKTRATTTGIRKTLSWRTIGLACGEEPLSSEESVQGVKTRLLEFNSYPVLPNDLAKSLYGVSEQHCGHAGKFFIDRLIAELSVSPSVIYDTYTAIQSELMAAWPEYFSVHIDAVSLVCLADYLVSQWLFNDSPTQAIDGARALAEYIMEQLPTRAQISDTERSWEFLKSWIVSNSEHFDFFEGPYGTYSSGRARLSPKYGRVDGDYIYITPQILSCALQDAGYPPQKIFKEWSEAELIETETDGGKRRYTVQKKFDSVKSRYIKIDKNKLCG